MSTTRSPLGAADDDLRLGRRADGREVLGGVGLAQRAADRAAVAHDGVGDDLLGVAEERVAPRQQVGLEQVDVPRQRPDADLAGVLADVGQLGELVDVDQVLGVGQPQLHHRQQAVAAGDDARLGAVLAEAPAIAPSTLVARSYPNGAGVCNTCSFRVSGRAGAYAAARRPRAARTGWGRRCR